MINFTVGPVMSEDYILEMGKEQVPYFRTPEFSKIMLENESIVKKFAKASANSRVCFVTGSGTASMEATVINCFNEGDRVLVVNGGSFGERFVEICRIHNIDYTEIKLTPGHTLTSEDLSNYDGSHYTGFIVNIHETSTGVYYNPEVISDYCKKNNLFLVVDAISSFMADEFRMQEWGVNVMITGSQKALAVPPGVSLVVLDEAALERVNNNKTTCMYLDFKSMLSNGERGQTPFTPAVGILIQIHERLKRVEEIGVDKEIERVKNLAEDFRSKIKDLPLVFFSNNMSNAVTTLKVTEGKDAYAAFESLKDEYGIWICPNGGSLKHEIFRVGHIGALKPEDNDILIKALNDLVRREIL